MSDAFQIMLDSGWLYFAAGAVICVILGVGALKRLFQGAKKPSHRTRSSAATQALTGTTVREGEALTFSACGRVGEGAAAAHKADDRIHTSRSRDWYNS
jgi:hypothetical protein